MSILSVFLQRKEGCAVEDCTALVLFFLFILHSGSLFILFARLPPCNPATPFEKGVDPKTFLRMGNIFLTERQRIRNAGAVDFRVPIYGYRAPSPLWCFVLSCMVGGIFRKPLGFRRCLPPARPEKAKPFQAGQSPCTKHPQTVRLGLHAPKKVFEGSKGRFFKNAPLAGSGTESHREKSQALLVRARLFRRDMVLSRNTHRPSGFAFTHSKKFLRDPRGVFSKTLPWQGVGQSPTERKVKPCSSGHAFSGGTKSLHETPTDRPASPSRTQKSF